MLVSIVVEIELQSSCYSTRESSLGLRGDSKLLSGQHPGFTVLYCYLVNIQALRYFTSYLVNIQVSEENQNDYPVASGFPFDFRAY